MTSSKKNLKRRKKAGNKDPPPSTVEANDSKTPSGDGGKNGTGAATGRRKKRAGGNDNDEKEGEEEETLLQTFIMHPVVWITIGVCVPYGLYLTYLYILLQKPNYVRLAFPNLRPPVSVTDTRQVLIMGSMSSGTSQIASTLTSTFRGLEIGHEDSNAQWRFVRDGTVSWFHFVRYMELPSDEKRSVELRMQVAKSICGDGKGVAGGRHFQQIENMGFHPFMYREPALNCSYRKKVGDKCWMKECYRHILREMGCANRNDCEIPFRRALHQARNPLHTVESLTAKFCIPPSEGGRDEAVGSDGRHLPHESFLTFARALFPDQTWDEYNCLEVMSHYVLLYNGVLIEARKRGVVHGMYRIEESTPCHVAHLAGLWGEDVSRDDVVYPPHYDRIASICNDRFQNNTRYDAHVQPNIPQSAHLIIEKKENLINQGKVHLGWKELRQASATTSSTPSWVLEQKMKDLFRELGYDASHGNAPPDASEEPPVAPS